MPGNLQQRFIEDTPFRGIGAGSFERAAGERGNMSNRSQDLRQPSSGVSGGQMQQRQGGEGSRGGNQGGGSLRER
jgi:hypothetical protein